MSLATTTLTSPAEHRAKRDLALAGLEILILWHLLTQRFAGLVSNHPTLGSPLFVTGSSLSLLGRVLLAFAALGVAWAASRRDWPRLHLGLMLAALGWTFSSSAALYPPWFILIWLGRFHDSEVLASELSTQRWLAWGVAGGIALIQLLVYLARTQSPAFHALHGSARFASADDIERAGLLERRPVDTGSQAVDDAVFLGVAEVGGRLRPLTVTKPRHTLVVAPSRSGKGVGVVLPTLLSWGHSAVVLDVKGENAHRSSGYRRDRLGQTVFIWNPTDPLSSAAHNPLSEVRRGVNEVRDCMIISDELIDPYGSKKDRGPNHWERTAHDLLVGLLLHVLYAETEKTLPACASLLSKPGTALKATLQRMRDTPHLVSSPHPRVAEIAQTVLNKAEEEQTGVVSTAMSALTLYRDPLIASITSRSDFRLSDLTEGPVPATLYMVIPPGDQDRVLPLIRLMLTQLVQRLVERMEFLPDPEPAVKTRFPRFSSSASKDSLARSPQNRRHPLLLLLDEFPTLGSLPTFERNLGLFAGYGVSSVLVCQDLTQLRKAYGPQESISGNCDYKFVLTPNMPETARVISELCGETTIHHRHLSRPASPFSSARSTSSQAETRRPLMTIDEVLRMPPEEALIFANACPAIKARRFRYFDDPVFRRRAQCAPATESDRLPTPNPWDRLTPPPSSKTLNVSEIPRRSPRFRQRP